MKMNQIKVLLALREKDHPVLGRLFKKYNFPIITILINSIVGISCVFLLSLAFYGLYSFFSKLEDIKTVVLYANAIVFVISFIFSIRKVYDFLYSDSDKKILKPLPIKKTYITVSNFIHLFKNNVYSSLYVFTAALCSCFGNRNFITILFTIIIMTIVIPAVSVLWSMVIAFIVHFVIKKTEKIKRYRQLTFHIHSDLYSLFTYEAKNFSYFSTLKVEILMQLFYCISIISLALTINIKYFGLLIAYPSLSMINCSSFSREGRFHFVLKSLPITETKRIFVKLFFYLVIELPIIFASTIFLYVKKNEIILLVSLIPNILCISNIALAGIITDANNPRCIWNNPQEVFRMNYPILFLSLLLVLVTESLIFSIIPMEVRNIHIGSIIAALFNLVIFLLCIKKVRKME